MMTQNKNLLVTGITKGIWPLFLVFWFSSPTLLAHDIDITGVARVFLDEYPNGDYRVSVADQQVPPLFDIERILPQRCEGLTPSRYSYRFNCQPKLNADDSLTLPWNLQGAVLVAKWLDGSSVSSYFPGEGTQIIVPMGEVKAGSASLESLASRYTALGIEHILFGIDHLLFIAGLLLLLKGFSMLVATVTAFTIAHSLTLAVAVLGYFPVPGPPIEALIALSIAFLAREVIMGQQGQTTLTQRKPWIVAFSFGLIHGFGFAGALGELGLASEDIPLALLFFNLGVEAGQLAFIAVLFSALWLFQRFLSHWKKPLELWATYCLGSIGLFWFAERLPGLFPV